MLNLPQLAFSSSIRWTDLLANIKNSSQADSTKERIQNMCVDQRELQIALDDVEYYRSEADRLPELEGGRTDQVHRKANEEMRRHSM